MPWSSLGMDMEFQFTHPVRGATVAAPASLRRRSRFNSRTPCGVRPTKSPFLAAGLKVSIHAPRAGCDVRGGRRGYGWCSFNSRTPCGVRLGCRCTLRLRCAVSIHAPRAGCDYPHPGRPEPPPSFNSRTPCGVRPQSAKQAVEEQTFQFTHPVRGATSILSVKSLTDRVSIHAPRAGCD